MLTAELTTMALYSFDAAVANVVVDVEQVISVVVVFVARQ